MLKTVTLFSILFIAAAIAAHAYHPRAFNELARAESEIEEYRQGAVIGWWNMDSKTKELYFVGR
jgi:hypothetical protein